MRMALAEAVEADELERVLRLGAAFVLGDAAQRQRKLDVLFRRQPRKQAGFLKHHADAIGVGLGDWRAADGDGARSLLAQAGHHHQKRRLAAAARTDQHNEPAGLDIERDILQRDDVLRRGLEELPDIADLDRAGRFQQGYVRQWLHRVSTHLTSSLKAIAITAIITTPASNCFIWKFSPQVAI